MTLLGWNNSIQPPPTNHPLHLDLLRQARSPKIRQPSPGVGQPIPTVIRLPTKFNSAKTICRTTGVTHYKHLRFQRRYPAWKTTQRTACEYLHPMDKQTAIGRRHSGCSRRCLPTKNQLLQDLPRQRKSRTTWRHWLGVRPTIPTVIRSPTKSNIKKMILPPHGATHSFRRLLLPQSLDSTAIKRTTCVYVHLMAN